MSKALQIATKDLRILGRDPVGMFAILGFPICMAVFFGMVMGGSGSRSAKLKIAVVDQDNTPFSQQFRDSIKDSANIQLVDQTEEEARNSIRRGGLLAMLILPKGFGETAGILWETPPEIQLAIDPSRKSEAAMLEGFIMKGMGKLVGKRFQDPQLAKDSLRKVREQLANAEDIPVLQRTVLETMFESIDAALGELGDWQEQQSAAGNESVVSDSMPGMQMATMKRIDVVRQKSKSAQLRAKIRSTWDLSFPQATMWSILGCTMGFAISMVRERGDGTYFRLAVSPLTRQQVLVGKSLACFLALIGVMTLMVLIGIGLGMRPRHYDRLILAVVCSAVAFVGIMMVTSVMGKTEEAVNGIGWSFNVLMAMFGGGMIPLAFMPDFMKSLSHFSPIKWSILALEGAVWRDFSYAEMMWPCGVLLGIGAVAYVIGLLLIAAREN